MLSGRFTALTAAVSLGLALAPVAAHADVRIEEQATTLGSKIKRWTFIQGDRRSLVTRAEPKGLLYDAGARYGVFVEIARPDRDILWEVEPKKRSYREVPAAAFRNLLQQASQPPLNANDQPLRTLYGSETTSVDVKPTGKQRRIAGLPAEQVIASVEVGALNRISGSRLRFRFEQEVWLCKDPRLVREVREFEEAYYDSFGTLATLTQARLLSGYWSDAFVTHLRALDDHVRTLDGYPLAVTTTVYEEALAQSEDEKATRRQQVIGSLEVRSVRFDPIPDSEFEVPVGYVNVDTNIAVQPAPATPEQPTTATAGASEAAKPVSSSPAASSASTAPERQPQTPPAAATGLPPRPAAPSSPGIPIITAPPSNVIVPEKPVSGSQSTARSDADKSRKSRATVNGTTPSNASPVQPGLRSGIATTSSPPPPVTVDQPVPSKRKRR